MDKVVKDWFDGSLHGLVSSFVEKNDLDVQELDDIMKLLKAHKKR
jgi:predicted transcriptional regulator